MPVLHTGHRRFESCRQHQISFMPYVDKEQQRAYQARWYRERRERWIKEHGPCIDCSSWNNLQVDHVNPELKVSHRIWSWSNERRERELKKCVVRCAPCHQQKTNADNNYSSHSAYGYGRGCRCDICRAANATKVKLWRTRGSSRQVRAHD